MPSLQPIWVENPEEEPKTTLYGRITNSDTPPLYDDIMNSDLSKEDKVKQIQYRTQAYQDDLDKQLNKDLARMNAGTALSATSFHPFFNIPYVGTGIGGAMYDLGQGIVEGDTAGDLAKRAGRGFVIGETIGAIPYAGKALGKTKAGQAVINSAPVQAVGGALNKAGEKFANSKLYDALMTDVRAFNPNKQTVYHGSPYDFEKFSNGAIGTGEGAQAHGYGHYAALDKNVADTRYRNRLTDNNIYKSVELNGSEIEKVPYGGYQYKNSGEKAVKDNGLVLDLTLKRLAQNNNNVEKTIESVSKELDVSNPWKYDIIKFLQNNDLKVTPNTGQLYKLSVPKDDVMLREGARLDKQPKIVQDAFNQIRQEYLNLEPLADNKTLLNYFGNKIGAVEDIYEREAMKSAIKVLNGGKLSANEWQELNNLNYQDLHKLDAYFTNGEDILKRLQNQFWDKPNKEELAQKILYDKGIKGISYNGGIDGEARVIFNPDDIVIGRKYYNQPNLYEQLTGKQNTGALVDALFNR